MEGERQHVQGGPPESVEFRSLEVRPWVRVCEWGLGPVQLEGVSDGVSKCRGRALDGGVEAGLGLCMVGGRLQGQKIRPRSPTGSPVPKWTGKALATFLSIPLPLPKDSLFAAGPLTVGGSRWV